LIHHYCQSCEKLLDIDADLKSATAWLLFFINSAGGSIVQAKTISDLLKLYSNRYKFLSP
jgi:ATP-dependent protease ClpP protease subunit